MSYVIFKWNTHYNHHDITISNSTAIPCFIYTKCGKSKYTPVCGLLICMYIYK